LRNSGPILLVFNFVENILLFQKHLGHFNNFANPRRKQPLQANTNFIPYIQIKTSAVKKLTFVLFRSNRIECFLATLPNRNQCCWCTKWTHW